VSTESLAWNKANPEKMRGYWKKYYAANRAKRLENSKKWRKNNPDKLKAQRAKYHRDNPHKTYLWSLKTRYGLSQHQYREMLSKQQGLCAICGDLMKKINVDHDHKTGKVRGLLCFTCNSMLGCSKDNQNLLSAGVAYLQKHK
jgi:hypothetical protein